MKKILISLSICCILVSSLMAQNKEIGLFAGISHYMGDLVPTTIETKETNVAIGIFGRHYLNDKMAIRIGGTYTTLSGSDLHYPDRAERGLSFKSTFIEAAVIGEYHFLGKSRYSETGIFEKNFSPYIFGGLGAGFNDPKTTGLDPTNPDSDGYGAFKFAIPLGAGLRFDLNEQLRLGIEVGLRPTLSDAIDGVQSAGNPENNDWYHMSGITLSYSLQKAGTKSESMDK